MSAFWIGQRVRLARPTYPENYGNEGVVIGFCFWPKGTACRNGKVLQSDCDCEVRWDGDGDWSAQNTSQLEPILPDDLESLEEINALWEPSPVEALENAAMRKESRP